MAAKRKSKRRIWWEHHSGSVAFVAVLVVGAVLLTAAQNASHNATEAADDAQMFAHQGFRATLAAAKSNCRHDRRFRIQYKRRGRATTFLLRVAIDRERHLHSPLAREQLRRLKRQRDRIRLIPVPSCFKQQRRLEHDLRQAEADSP